MSEVCSKRGCENTRFKDDKYCILHCNKKGFEDQRDINLFWQKFREKYPYNTREELIIENIKFPKFQTDNYSRGYLHSHRNLTYYENVKFKKCIFFDNFNSLYDQYSKTLIFEDSIFYGDFDCRSIFQIELINCEFKIKIVFQKGKYKNIDIKNTKFIKEVDIHVVENLNIDENTICRDNIIISSAISIQCQNSQIDKEFTISSASKVLLDNLEIKANIFLKQCHDIVLKNITFQKSLTLDSLNSIKFENINICHLELNGANKIEIFDSNILGDLVFKELLQSLTINNSLVEKETKAIKSINNINILNMACFNGNITFLGDHNDVNIKNSTFKSLFFNATHTLNIQDSSFDELKLLGEIFHNVKLQNIKLKNLLEINNVQGLQIDKIECEALKSIGNACGVLKIVDYRIQSIDFESKEYTTIELGLGFQECTINVKSNKVEKVLLNSYKIKVLNIEIKSLQQLLGNSCHIEEFKIQSITNELFQLDACEIKNFITLDIESAKRIVFSLLNSNPTIQIKVTSFDEINLLDSSIDTLYINNYQNLEDKTAKGNKGVVTINHSQVENDCNIYDIQSLNIIDNTELKGSLNTSLIQTDNSKLSIDSSILNYLDCRLGNFKNIIIYDTVLENRVLFNSSQISSLVIDGKIKPTTFKALVDFELSNISQLSINNSNFEDTINFANNNKKITLSKISNSKIEELNIYNNLEPLADYKKQLVI